MAVATAETRRRADYEAAVETLDCSDDERIALLSNAAIENMPRTREELRNWVHDWLGFLVPDTQVCSNHCTPMDYLWALYCDWEPGYERGAAIAARDSYKTLITAIAEFLDLQFKNCDTIHAGAIDEQAKKCYQYLSGFLNLPVFKNTYARNLRSQTEMHRGATIKILPCTARQMNGQHAPKLRIDELDLADESGLKEAKGIPCTDPKNGTPPSVWYISSWKFAHGPVSRIVKKMQEGSHPGKVMTWCWKEATVRCPDERSGTKPVTIYCKPEMLKWYREEQYRLLNPEQKSELTPYQVYDGCLKCPLVGSCRGDLKRAGGIKPIEDWIVKMDDPDTDLEFWISQVDCLRPGRSGLAFPNFTEANQTHFDWSPDRATYASNDYGFGHPDVTLIGQMFEDKTLLITHERCVTQQDVQQTARDFKTHFTQFNPKRLFVDPSASHAIHAYRGENIPAVGAPNDEELGRRLVNRLIISPKDGKRRLLINYRCKGLIEQMETLALKQRLGVFSDEIQDVGDDYYKALKYMVLGLYCDRRPRLIRRAPVPKRGGRAYVTAN